jgi:hypothetical protein
MQASREKGTIYQFSFSLFYLITHLLSSYRTFLFSLFPECLNILTQKSKKLGKTGKKY